MLRVDIDDITRALSAPIAAAASGADACYAIYFSALCRCVLRRVYAAGAMLDVLSATLIFFALLSPPITRVHYYAMMLMMLPLRY